MTEPNEKGGESACGW